MAYSLVLVLVKKKAGEPRFRLDYQWHDEEQDNLMMQVEVPF